MNPFPRIVVEVLSPGSRSGPLLIAPGSEFPTADGTWTLKPKPSKCSRCNNPLPEGWVRITYAHNDDTDCMEERAICDGCYGGKR